MGMNFDSRFFEKNPSAKLPVFQNGSHVLFDTIEITQYIERIAKVTRGGEESSLSSGEVVEWVYKIQQWNPKLFTLSHTPPKYRLKVTKFLRRVIIARVAERPELASAYHRKLKEAYDAEDKLKDPDTLRRSEEHLEKILDEADEKLSQTTYLLGEEFTLADIVLVPLLSRLVLLNLKNKYVATRPHLAKYWILVKKRPSYIKVIGKYFDGWRQHNTRFKTWYFLQIKSLLKTILENCINFCYDLVALLKENEKNFTNIIVQNMATFFLMVLCFHISDGFKPFMSYGMDLSMVQHETMGSSRIWYESEQGLT